jgi:ribonuclease HI
MTGTDKNRQSWSVYADGACAPTNPGPCAWGTVVLGPETEPKFNSGFIGHGTNQIAELTAAIHGLAQVPKGAFVELVSDSKYVLNGLTIWRAGWQRNGFKNSKKEVIANLKLWQALYEVADTCQLTTRWVKGHSGDHFNERADSLATEALAKNKSLELCSASFKEPATGLSAEVANAISALSFVWESMHRGLNPFCNENGRHAGSSLQVFALKKPGQEPQCHIQWRDLQVTMGYTWPHNGSISRMISSTELKSFLLEGTSELVSLSVPLQDGGAPNVPQLN